MSGGIVKVLLLMAFRIKTILILPDVIILSYIYIVDEHLNPLMDFLFLHESNRIM